MVKIAPSTSTKSGRLGSTVLALGGLGYLQLVSEQLITLIGPCPLDMLLYADDLESLATSREGRIGIVQLLVCYGIPFHMG